MFSLARVLPTDGMTGIPFSGENSYSVPGVGCLAAGSQHCNCFFLLLSCMVLGLLATTSGQRLTGYRECINGGETQRGRVLHTTTAKIISNAM